MGAECCSKVSTPVISNSFVPEPETSTPPAKTGGCCGPKPKDFDVSSVKNGSSGGCCSIIRAPVTSGPSVPAPEVLKSPKTNSGCCSRKENASEEYHSVPIETELVEKDVTHEDVSEYYANQVTRQEDLQTSACLLEGEETKELRKLVGNVHPVILTKFYGCGSPIPPLLEGTTVVDLGCGTGKDVYVAAQLVGEHGRVIGIDMTDEQLTVARQHQEWHRVKFGFQASNVELHKGFMEDLSSAGIANESVDVVISNCVINLAPSKGPVLKEVARVLKPGGELFFSDVFADRRVPDHLQKDKVLFGECLSGALYLGDFRRLMKDVGLGAWGIVSERLLSINNSELEAKLGDIRFYSMTVRAVKVPPGDLEEAPEDYGQMATYDGSIRSCPDVFSLDSSRKFPKSAATPVDSTTAAMLTKSRYSGAFTVSERGPHKGPFTQWTEPLGCVPGSWVPTDKPGATEAACCC